MAKRYKHYVYQHVRISDNQIFYIGIGTKSPSKKLRWKSIEFARANAKCGRTLQWKEYVSYSGGYRVEILLESNDLQACKKKEIELIELYGRVDLGTGTLMNRKPGGDAHTVFKPRYGTSNHAAQPILQYDLEGNFLKKFDTIVEAAKETGVKFTKISNCICLERVKSGGGYRWFKYYDNYPLKIAALGKPDNCSWKRSKKILQFDLMGNFVREWDGCDQPAKYLKGNKANIRAAIKNNWAAYEYFWYYKEGFENDLHKLKKYRLIEKDIDRGLFNSLVDIHKLLYDKLSIDTVRNLSCGDTKPKDYKIYPEFIKLKYKII